MPKRRAGSNPVPDTNLPSHSKQSWLRPPLADDLAPLPSLVCTSSWTTWTQLGLMLVPDRKNQGAPSPLIPTCSRFVPAVVLPAGNQLKTGPPSPPIFLVIREGRRCNG
jgi:hypothetical protein